MRKRILKQRIVQAAKVSEFGRIVETSRQQFVVSHRPRRMHGYFLHLLHAILVFRNKLLHAWQIRLAIEIVKAHSRTQELIDSNSLMSAGGSCSPGTFQVPERYFVPSVLAQLCSPSTSKSMLA